MYAALGTESSVPGADRSSTMTVTQPKKHVCVASMNSHSRTTVKHNPVHVLSSRTPHPFRTQKQWEPHNPTIPSTISPTKSRTPIATQTSHTLSPSCQQISKSPFHFQATTKKSTSKKSNQSKPAKKAADPRRKRHPRKNCSRRQCSRMDSTRLRAAAVCPN